MIPPAETARLLTEARRLHGSGQFDEAENRYKKILKHEPKNADALSLLGSLYLQRSDAQSAVDVLVKAVHLRPNAVAPLINLGTAYRTLQQPAKAADYCRRATALDPQAAAGFYNLGHALRDASDHVGAAAAYRRYLELEPRDADGHVILGDTWRAAGALDDAMEAYETALAYNPAHVAAHINIAGIAQARGLWHAALAILEGLASIAPSDPEAEKDFGTAQLQLGLLAEGWPRMKARFDGRKERIVKRSTPPPYWNGEALTGKHILIWTEQGLGDEILYAGMVDEVLAAADRCVIECSDRMEPVFRRSFPKALVLARDAAGHTPAWPANLDFQVASMSLGQYLRPDFASFPRHRGYLYADADKAAKLRTRYAELAGGRRIVGISWRSKNADSGVAKSIALRTLAETLHKPEVMLVNLQYGDCREDIAACRAQGIEILDDRSVDALVSMDDFLAQVAAMDLVVTTSNTTAHVAGAQNIPAWVLLPASNGLLWYWFLKRDGSPWYPSVRLIRAAAPGSAAPWEKQIIARLAADFSTWAAA